MRTSTQTPFHRDKLYFFKKNICKKPEVISVQISKLIGNAWLLLHTHLDFKSWRWSRCLKSHPIMLSAWQTLTASVSQTGNGCNSAFFLNTYAVQVKSCTGLSNNWNGLQKVLKNEVSWKVLLVFVTWLHSSSYMLSFLLFLWNECLPPPPPTSPHPPHPPHPIHWGALQETSMKEMRGLQANALLPFSDLFQAYF